jgi:nicotinamidase-related amidase
MTTPPPFLHCAAFSLAAVALIAVGAPFARADIIKDWAMVKSPPVPELKPVTLDGKTTAFLSLDMMKGNCGGRPRCLATVPNIKRLMDAARAAGSMVFHTLVISQNPADIVDPAIGPREGEGVVFVRGPDKFLGTDLEKRLKDWGVTTVIVTGTLAQGAVLGAANASAQRGYKVIVPVDGMSSEDIYGEQYTAWHLYKGGPAFITNQVTLTRSDMIKF